MYSGMHIDPSHMGPHGRHLSNFPTRFTKMQLPHWNLTGQFSTETLIQEKFKININIRWQKQL